MSRGLNDIETASLMTGLITVYCGIFFVSSKDKTNDDFDPNQDFSLNETSIYILFIVIVVCNISFFLAWLFKFTMILKIYIRDKYPKIYLYLFLCGRKDK
jgi:hypothetical protein